MADRNGWEHITARTRRLAIAADAELRRRATSNSKSTRCILPHQLLFSEAATEQRDPAKCDKLTESVPRIRDLATQHQDVQH